MTECLTHQWFCFVKYDQHYWFLFTLCHITFKIMAEWHQCLEDMEIVSISTSPVAIPYLTLLSLGSLLLSTIEHSEYSNEYTRGCEKILLFLTSIGTCKVTVFQNVSFRVLPISNIKPVHSFALSCLMIHPADAISGLNFTS